MASNLLSWVPPGSSASNSRQAPPVVWKEEVGLGGGGVVVYTGGRGPSPGLSQSVCE